MIKKDILKKLEDQREHFLDAIDDLTETDLTTPGICGEWSIKDIMSHLSRWEAELVKLLWQVSQGQRPSSIHFTSKLKVDQINQLWFKESLNRTYHQVIYDFHSVRNQTILRVESFSDQQLTNAQEFSGLHGKALWEWIQDDSFGHEAEHIQDIQQWQSRRLIEK